MNKKENVRESLKQLRLGRAIAFEIKGIRHFAIIIGKYIRISSFGECTCKNTIKDWYIEFGNAKSFELLSTEFTTMVFKNRI